MGRGSGGCYTGRDSVTGELIARRRTFDKVREPPYSASEVPKCSKDLVGSVLLAPPSRQCWFHSITEMLLLCNDAASRFAKLHPFAKKADADGVQSKPLGLEYMADRLDTDDPIWGYMVRREREGWLQGFITLTNFTTWHKDFEWNSLVRESAISDEEKRTRLWDSDNSLAMELQAQDRTGDPDDEGIIWKRVAEISLLGALGCGSQLVQLVLDELEAGGEYDYVVLQATENAIGFYESMGFKRVGAIAAPDQEAMAEQAALASARAEERARQREEEREAKKSGKKDKLSSKLMQTSSMVLAQMGVWTDSSGTMLDALQHQYVASNVGQRCPEIESTLSELFAFLEQQRQVDATLHPSQCMSGTQHVVDAVWRCLTGLGLERNAEVQSDCSALLHSFCASWRSFHGLNASTSAEVTESSTFYVYVDTDWQYRYGFRLFEVINGPNDNGDVKTKVLAREWKVSKELEQQLGFDPSRLCFSAKAAKPHTLSFTPRRNADGERQTELLQVKVSRETLNAGGVEYLQVDDQCRNVAMAYVKLFAVRAIEANERSSVQPKPSSLAASTGGKDSTEGQEEMSDADGSRDEGPADVEMSEYERERQLRILENSRILQASGIIEASQQVSSTLAEGSAGARSATVQAKRPREPVDVDDMPKRVLRARMCKGDGGEGVAPPMESSELSDSETPVKRSDELDKKPLLFSEVETKASEVASQPMEWSAELQMTPELPFPEDGLYIACEDDTPREISRKFGLDARSLVELNKDGYKGLLVSSRLRRGTLLKLPRPGQHCCFVPSNKLTQKGGGWSAYCHWTYPDQAVEDLFPSYMMARKLTRNTDGGLPSHSATTKQRLSKIPPPIRSATEVEEIEAHEARVVRIEQQASDQNDARMDDGIPRPLDDLYVCAEDDKVCSIAKKFLVDTDQLVMLNRTAYPQLNKTAPLREGTLLKLPPPLSKDSNLLEWCRGPWFEPCLAMVRKLAASRHSSPFAQPLDWEALDLPDYPFLVSNPMDLKTVETKLLANKYASPRHFANEVRLIFKNAMAFNDAEGDPVHQAASRCLNSFESMWSSSKLDQATGGKAALAAGKKRNMYNKVVTVEGKEGYFFVLHYIPDMQWCHIAQMAQFGVFPERCKSGKPHAFAGQPCWKLVPEGAGEELDVSAERCTIARVSVVYKVQDADKEAWVIHDAVPNLEGSEQHGGSMPKQAGAALLGKDEESVSWVKQGDKMLRNLTKDKLQAQPFMQVLDVADPAAVRYYQQIERPIDIATVWKKLLGGSYQTGSRFLADLELVFDNSIAYYGSTSETTRSALELKTQVSKHSLRSTALRPCFLELHPDAKPAIQKKVAEQGGCEKQSGQRHKPRESRAVASQSDGAKCTSISKLQFEMEYPTHRNTAEAQAVLEAQAQLIPSSARTTVSKVTEAVVKKVLEHHSGKIIKISNILPPNDLERLLKGLHTNRSTTRLDLEGCGAGDFGCGLVRDLVTENKRVAELDLQMNQISDAGVKELAKAIPRSGLREVNLGNNGVGREGVQALLEAVLEQGKLTGVMAKLVGLREDFVGAVRDELAASLKHTDSQTDEARQEVPGVSMDVSTVLASTSSPLQSFVVTEDHEPVRSLGPGAPPTSEVVETAVFSGSGKSERSTAPVEVSGTERLPSEEADSQTSATQYAKQTNSNRLLWRAECHGLLRRLCKHAKAWPFLEPVDPFEAEAPDYFTVIKRPMDLGTVCHKLEAGTYSGPVGLLSDVELTFRNAMEYNPEESAVHGLAVAMRGVFETECTKSVSLGRVLEKVRQKVEGAVLEDVQNRPADAMSTEEEAVRASQALLVQGSSQTLVGKVTDSLIQKALEHQTGKIVKISKILPQDDLERLLKGLHTNRSTTRLDLEGCGAGDFGCGLVRDLVSENKRVAELDLQMNQISDAGVKELAKAIPRSGLREVNLGNNGVGREGVQALLEAVLEQGKLTGVMAKLVGLREDLVAKVRKGLAAKWREQAQHPAEETMSVEEEEFEDPADQFLGQHSLPGGVQPSSCPAALTMASNSTDAGQCITADTEALTWKAECNGLLRRLCKHAKAWPFLEPVDPFEAEAPDYFTVIKRPMDLGTVCHKLEAGTYSGPVELLSDVDLTFRNAMEYNPGESAVHGLAKEMRNVLHMLCNGSRSLRSALEEVLESKMTEVDQVGAGGSGLEATKRPIETTEAREIRDALAQKVPSSARTTVSKVTEAVVKKVLEHHSGKIIKISTILPPNDLERLLKGLHTNRSTTRLDLEGCGAGDFGCGLVRDLVTENKRVAELDLQMNQISDAGVKELAKAIPRSGLREVNLGNNGVGREGVQALLEAVLEQGKLTGVMAKLVGLREDVVAEVRSVVVSVQRQSATSINQPE